MGVFWKASSNCGIGFQVALRRLVTQLIIRLIEDLELLKSSYLLWSETYHGSKNFPYLEPESLWLPREFCLGVKCLFSVYCFLFSVSAWWAVPTLQAFDFDFDFAFHRKQI